jgi:hypothetical protein
VRKQIEETYALMDGIQHLINIKKDLNASEADKSNRSIQLNEKENQSRNISKPVHRIELQSSASQSSYKKPKPVIDVKESESNNH